ncbi:GbsR/MarR family transcriptional regulator [Rugosimonospora africana]|uniref:MarR family transcriptional regulator n=1 Tax=Rugosimonospora africana TaxID=556532 RepID=A0A8J3QRZ3_9ACTN|nr:MarR family transcriptional regulator [Rugosimonospora africana]GIH14483.1 MarR family transcriptional regulator [Rugosimonospora africana]
MPVPPEPARNGAAPHDAAAARDPQAVLAFIERFASALADAGMPRMPARVFTGLLASDPGRLGAAELAALLQVSPAAISGAVRYLAQVNLVSRERDPAVRRDVYRVRDDVWYEAILSRDPLLDRWDHTLREGIEVLGPDTPAGYRLADTVAFFEFMRVELPALLERWRAFRQTRPATPPG